MTSPIQTQLSSAERKMVISSAITTIIIGAAYVLARWAMRHQLIDGALRSITLACILIAVHAWGLDAYRRQSEGSFLRRTYRSFCRNFKQLWNNKCVGLALVQQTILLVFSTSILDGGGVMQLCGAAIALFWMAVSLTACMRSGSLTKVDVALVKGGFIPLLFFIAAAQGFVWHLKSVR